MSEIERIEEALRLLAERIRAARARYPEAEARLERREKLALELDLSLDPGDEELRTSAERLARSIDEGIQEIVSQASAFAPGRVLNLRTGSAEGPECTPSTSREVFAGYGTTGIPRFVDFAELMLDCRDPRVEQLYDERLGSQPVALILDEDALTGELLAAFRDETRGYRVHGQVCIGFYRVRDPAGRPNALALTFQVISTRRRRGGRRFGLNVLGRGPDGESLEHLHDRLGSLPWRGAARWAGTVLASIEKSVSRKTSAAQLARRIEGLLSGLARRLERGERSRGRRTAHAEERHHGGERPTRMAVLDLERAGANDLLFDTRRQTIVVLGERGRAHVFSAEGKLVTSVRYPPATIDRRRKSGLWRSASPEEIEALRQVLPRNGTGENGSLRT